jgi:hypothetical protein
MRDQESSSSFINHLTTISHGDIHFLRLESRSVLASTSTPNLIFDYWDGGCDEVFPTALPCTYKGADFGMLGELVASSWHCVIEEDALDEVCAHLWVDITRTPFCFHKWLTLRKDKNIINKSKRIF